MKLKVPYGREEITFEVEGFSSVDIVNPIDRPGTSDVIASVEEAINSPIGTECLGAFAKPGASAAIVVNDITRPTPSAEMVRICTRELIANGVAKSDITLVVATGNHRPNTVDELERMLGVDTVREFRVVNHKCSNTDEMVCLGATSGGVPVWVNRVVVEADIKILTGLITPHHSAGYSGGRKSILPGVSGIDTLRIHHSLPIRPFEPALGWLEGNAFHEQAVEAARMVGVDFIVNTVPNRKKEIVRTVAGDVYDAHIAGTKVCRDIWAVNLESWADIAIVSPGGYPRDINLHQAQKALSCAELLVRPGGVVILVAECSDGIGDFASWLKSAKSPESVIERFREEGYTQESSAKAFMFARGLTRFDVIIVSKSLAADEVEDMFMSKAESIEDALRVARKRVGSGARVIAVPYANEVMPVRAEAN
jgi:nickel-dependent lactate racemase